MTAEAKKPLVVIGTSGSHDYLKDSTGNKRFWPVGEPSEAGGAPISPEDEARLKAYLAASGPLNIILSNADDEACDCDGLHDEGAPAQYLCTRCFPDPGRGDLGQGHDDEDAYGSNPRETE